MKITRELIFNITLSTEEAESLRRILLFIEKEGFHESPYVLNDIERKQMKELRDTLLKELVKK